ncbi:MAG: carboxymuconolactone decarboxylase family protein [Blastomonas sp.]
MRIQMPHDTQDPFSDLGLHYAADMVGTAKTFSQTVYARTTLPLRVFEGARARTAEINGCMVCRAFRAARDIPKYSAKTDDAAQGVIANGDAPDEDFYQNVTNWKTYAGYNDRERMAIEFAERFCIEPQALAKDEDFWSRAKQAFSDEELVELCHCVGSFIATGRVAHVLGLDLICSIPTIGEAA